MPPISSPGSPPPPPPLIDVVVPLGVIFFMQTLITMTAYGISVIAPDAAGDMGLDPESVGFLAASVYLAAMMVGLMSDSWMRRFGPTRTFQALVGLAGLGALALMAGYPLLAFLGALLIGAGTGPMNPAGSHVLARVSPPRWLPLVFSVKQCGTPAGGMLAGAVLPPLAALYDWRLALALIPLAAVALIGVAPAGRLGSRSAPLAAEPIRIGASVMASLRSALASGPLRSVVLMGACLGTAQLAIASYYVVYLWSVAGLTPTEAGRVFVAFHVSGIVARILLGAAAERFVPTRYLLPALGVVMGASTAAAAGFSQASTPSFVYAVTVVIGASGNGWVGLFFAELARLAPTRAAAVAGGGQFVMYVGIFSGPLVYGLLLKLGVTHAACFGVFAALAAGAALMPLLAGRGSVETTR